MPARILISIDSNDLTKNEILDELEIQIEALDIGELEKKSEASEGTLDIDLPTVLLILNLSEKAIKYGKGLIDLIKEARNKKAAEKNIPLEDVPSVKVTMEDNGEKIELEVPSSDAKEKKFLNAFDENGGD